MKINRIDHIGIIVKDAEKSIARLKELFGIEKVSIIDWTVKKELDGTPIEPYTLRMAFIPFENITIELMQVLDGKTIYDEFQGINGEGIHHVCVNCEDIDEVMEEAEKLGIKAFDTGKIAGSAFAYLNTQDQVGFLVEFLQTRMRKRKKNKNY
ncbi:MAG: VOC family protein [Candidatus Helarchaeota archaeon]